LRYIGQRRGMVVGDEEDGKRMGAGVRVAGLSNAGVGVNAPIEADAIDEEAEDDADGDEDIDDEEEGLANWAAVRSASDWTIVPFPCPSDIVRIVASCAVPSPTIFRETRCSTSRRAIPDDPTLSSQRRLRFDSGNVRGSPHSARTC